jgi:MSHA biogenesis protein MshO
MNTVRRTIKSAASRGFTLVELVITVLISAIISVGIISYIGDTVSGFISAGQRNQLASAGRTVLDRVALELHNAVPNSVRVNGAALNGDQCLEYIPFIRATSYVNAPFTGAGEEEFEMVDTNPALLQGPGAALQAVIYPINTAALYTGGSPGPRAQIDEIADPDVNDGRLTVTLTAPHRFSRRSPVQRIYIAQQPVSFCVVGSRLYRYSNYGFIAAQPDPASLPATAPNRALISDRISNTALTAFSVSAPTLRRNAIVSMEFLFVDQQESIRLNHEVQLRNVP